MKVICDRAALHDAINLVAGVASSRTPRPQLNCVKLTARRGEDGSILTLAATDTEQSLTLSISRVDVEEEGQCLVPAAKLKEIVSHESNEPTLTLETEGHSTHIRGADAHFQLHGFPESDFPPLPDFDSLSEGRGGNVPARAVFTQDAGTISQIVSRTVFATARENSRYAINGVLLKRDGKKLELVATDGRRLALCKAAVSDDGDGEPVACIVPTKALTRLRDLIGDPSDMIEIAITDNQIIFRLGGDGPEQATLSSSLVEGSFPPYEDVIPKDQDIRVRFDKDVLASAVRRAALLTNEESRGVRMSFTGADKRLELSSRAPEMGQATINVELTDYEGNDVEIGFNPAFILDALKVIDEPELLVELKDPKKPGLLRSGKDFTYVVMPVNLS